MRKVRITALLVPVVVLGLISPAFADYPVEPVIDETSTPNQIVATSTRVQLTSPSDTISSCTAKVNGQQVDCEVESGNGQVVISRLIGPKDRVEITVRNPAGVPFTGQADLPEEIFTLANVNFNAGSAALTTKARRLLDRVAKILQGRGYNRIVLIGHTDNQSTSAAFARELSANRARAVSNYLATKGLQLRVSIRAAAEDEPIASNNTKRGQALNRRVEIKVRP
jgi:OOP family OmpA-OmpF porin